jgi:hypothetical protein
MKPTEIYRRIAEMDFDKGVLTLSPGPLSLAVGESDKRAAEFLEWWMEKYPDARASELYDMMESAKWWFIFFVASYEAKQRQEYNAAVRRIAELMDIVPDTPEGAASPEGQELAALAKYVAECDEESDDG